jgi:dCTP deaminase
MVAANAQIIHLMAQNKVIIDPYNIRNLGTSSYDVRLGRNYYREQPSEYLSPPVNVYNIYSENHTDRVWGKKQLALPAIEYKYMPNFDFDNIAENDLVIPIGPGENLLCHTEEFIGGLNPFTTEMKARSSIGRTLLMVCSCAGWGDVGYFNRWTMEFHNRSRYYTIPLVVGRRVAQIVFQETGGVIDTTYALDGKYQSTENLAELKAKWKPELRKSA